MKILTVLGARPQFIKAATVSREFLRAGAEELIVHTGQHFDDNMSEVFFREMEIPSPHYNLEIHSLSHGAMTGRMLEKIEEVIVKVNPDRVLVYGDTNSTLAGALASAKLNIPVAHVEAGLRSFDMRMPEEINRIVTDRLSKILFCPTERAVRNLEKEGYRDFDCTIERPGDVMLDSVMYYRQKAAAISIVLEKNGLSKNGFALATMHRAENTSDPSRLESICRALNQIHEITPLVLPLHPRTRGHLSTLGIPLRVQVIEPVGYFDMLTLVENSEMVLTDSGGLQKEAYFFCKYCITLRNQTEWTELIDARCNFLAGADTGKIMNLFNHLRGKRMPPTESLYGKGNAARLIVDSLLKS